MNDYRWDPFSNTSTAISISDELHIIPSSSPFDIRLAEVPKKDTPSTLSIRIMDILSATITTSGETTITVTNGAWFAAGDTITIDSEQMYVSGVASDVLTVTRGYNGTTATVHDSGAAVYIESSMSEVESTPTSGQFWADYSTGADGQSDWNTGTILFNAADAGKTVVVSYVGTGTLVDIEKTRKLHKCIKITSSGEWICPEGVELVNVVLIGGGAGGSGYPADGGTNGGNSSFGNILSAGGGKKAVKSVTPVTPGTIANSLEFPCFSLNPRIGVPGPAGTGMETPQPATGFGNSGGNCNTASQIVCAGGSVNENGVAGESTKYGGTSGAGGLYAVGVHVTPGEAYNITIGAAGLGTGSTPKGGDGAPGICIIWY